MLNSSDLQSVQIQNLVTKFYYKDNHLCFQILLSTDTNQSLAYKEYTDYSEYKKDYNQLLQIKTAKRPFSMPKKNVETTDITFA